MTIIKGLQAELIKDMYRNTMLAKGYSFFDRNKPYNLNIIGVRRVENAIPNKFDDTLVVIYRERSEQWSVFTADVTTDPGQYWLMHPTNVKGTAILVPNQYRGAYKKGLHQGKYEALCQRGGNVQVYRDADGDRRHDMEEDKIDTGFFGINIHKAGRASVQVDKWSAGCQVFARSDDFATFMDLVDEGAQRHGDSFTYTLLLETDFNN
jgi:hypothetical protein|tara:strand:- start:1019 stop:1642 length:624 start_codon:yes stop_codon:yes gene_type:complete